MCKGGFKWKVTDQEQYYNEVFRKGLGRPVLSDSNNGSSHFLRLPTCLALYVYYISDLPANLQNRLRI